MNLNTIFRKCNCKAGDGKFKNIFQHQGYVLTEIKNNLDSAIDDAITVGAEEVEEIEDNEKYYKVSWKKEIFSFFFIKLLSI